MANNDDEMLDQLNEVSDRFKGKTKEAINWFRDKVLDLAGKAKSIIGKPVFSKDFPQDANKNFLTKRMNLRSVGRMVMYAYDPKTKDKLPYYDTLPLAIIVEFNTTGFYALNLHYVPPLVRKKIIDLLLPNMNVTAIGKRLSKEEQKKINMSYSILKNTYNIKALQPCFKRYLYSHVRSNFLFISPDEWEKTVLLPTEQFKKASKTKVFSDSMANGAGLISSNKPVSKKTEITKDIKTTNFFRKDE